MKFITFPNAEKGDRGYLIPSLFLEETVKHEIECNNNMEKLGIPKTLGVGEFCHFFNDSDKKIDLKLIGKRKILVCNLRNKKKNKIALVKILKVY